MSYTIRPAAPQQTYDHLAPVVDLLQRSLAIPKSENAAGARRWQMKLVAQFSSTCGRAYGGLKSLLAMVGVAAVCAAFALPLSARQDWLDALMPAALWEPPMVVAGP